MNHSKVSFKVACWSLVIGGIGHTLMTLLSPKTPEQIEIIDIMTNFTFDLLGSTSNLFSFHQGFSLMMGLLLFAYGLLNLFIQKNGSSENVAKNILLLNTLITLVCTLLSIKYFFLVPITITGLAFIGFSFAYLKRETA